MVSSSQRLLLVNVPKFCPVLSYFLIIWYNELRRGWINLCPLEFFQKFSWSDKNMTSNDFRWICSVFPQLRPTPSSPPKKEKNVSVTKTISISLSYFSPSGTRSRFAVTSRAQSLLLFRYIFFN